VSDAPRIFGEPKVEQVEYWTLISNAGHQVTYMIRLEIGEKGQILRNAIDNTPVEVQLMFKSGDAKNEAVAISSFPVVNLFNYTCEKGEHKVYPEGHGPADQQLAEIEHKRNDTLAKRKQMFEARIGAISDLADPPVK
jgi:hypothetical protein